MTEPRRLTEESPDTPLAQLFEQARDDAPGSGSRAKLLASLGLDVPPPPAGGGGAAPAAASGAGGKAIAVVALILAVGGGVELGRRALDQSPRQEQRTLLPAAANTPRRMAKADEAPREVESPAVATSAPARESAPIPSAPRTAPRGPSLADEVAALEAARRKLAGSDAKGALSQLDSYDRKFSQGSLSPEAEVLRIEASLAAGKSERARSLAQSFLARHPHSPHRQRVLSVLNQTKP